MILIFYPKSSTYKPNMCNDKFSFLGYFAYFHIKIKIFHLKFCCAYYLLNIYAAITFVLMDSKMLADSSFK